MEFPVKYRKLSGGGRCCVPNCESVKRKSDNVSFHKVPERNSGQNVLRTNLFGNSEYVDKRAEWLRILGVADEGKELLVCSLHFVKEDYNFPEVYAKSRVLKKTAVPQNPNAHSEKSMSDARRQQRRVVLPSPNFQNVENQHVPTFQQNIDGSSGAQGNYNSAETSVKKEPEEYGQFDTVSHNFYQSQDQPVAPKLEITEEYHPIDESTETFENKLQTMIEILEKKLATALLENDVLKSKNEELKKENEKLKSSNAKLQKIFTAGQVKALCNPGERIVWDVNDIANALILESISSNAYRYLSQVKKMPLPSVTILRKWRAHLSFDLASLCNMMTIFREKGRFLSNKALLTVLCLQTVKTSQDHREHCVVMARGLFERWKQIIYCGNILPMTKDLLLKIVEDLYKVDFTVVAVVFDTDSFNGLIPSLNLSNQCWFQHPTHGTSKIFTFVDSLALMNRLRDSFLHSGIEISGRNIDTTIVKKVIDICKTVEISVRHIHVKSRDSNLAVQLFSNNVADAFISCKDNTTDPLPWKEASELFKMISSWFSLFQSNSVNGYGADLLSQNTVLDNMTRWGEELQTKNVEKDYPEGILQNNRSLRFLYEYLQENSTFRNQFIATRRLSNDIVNDFVSYMIPDVNYRFKDYVIGHVFSIRCNLSDLDWSKITNMMELTEETVQDDDSSDEISIKNEPDTGDL